MKRFLMVAMLTVISTLAFSQHYVGKNKFAEKSGKKLVEVNAKNVKGLGINSTLTLKGTLNPLAVNTLYYSIEVTGIDPWYRYDMGAFSVKNAVVHSYRGAYKAASDVNEKLSFKYDDNQAVVGFDVSAMFMAVDGHASWGSYFEIKGNSSGPITFGFENFMNVINEVVIDTSYADFLIERKENYVDVIYEGDDLMTTIGFSTVNVDSAVNQNQNGFVDLATDGFVNVDYVGVPKGTTVVRLYGRDIAISPVIDAGIVVPSVVLGEGYRAFNRPVRIATKTSTRIGSSGNKGNADGFSLSQNYPNPFNPVTAISYSVPSRQAVNIEVYDVTGRKVETLMNEIHEAGSYQIAFNGDGHASGTYFCRMTVGGKVQTVKMNLIK